MIFVLIVEWKKSMSEEITQFNFATLEGKVTKLEEKKQEIIQEEPKPPIVPKKPRKRTPSLSDLEELKARIEKLEKQDEKEELGLETLSDRQKRMLVYLFKRTQKGISSRIRASVKKEIKLLTGSIFHESPNELSKKI
jgi:hypothetical protein